MQAAASAILHTSLCLSPLLLIEQRLTEWCPHVFFSATQPLAVVAATRPLMRQGQEDGLPSAILPIIPNQEPPMEIDCSNLLSLLL